MSAEQIELKAFVKNQLINTAKKLKGKHSPFSEVVEKVSKTITVKRIYKLNEKLKNCYLIVTNNYSKRPKLRYFITKILAFQSSDLLVRIAKEFAKENEINLIQYSLYPSAFRVNLLAIKELKNTGSFSREIDILEKFHIEFQRDLTKIRNLMKK